MNPTSVHMVFAQDFPPLYTSLCSTAIGYIQQAMPSQTDSDTDIHPDRHLPPICEALILVSQCVQTILLREGEQVSRELREGLKKSAEGGGAIEKSVGMSKTMMRCGKYNNHSRVSSTSRSPHSSYCVREGRPVPFGWRWTFCSRNTETYGPDWLFVREA